MYKLAVFVSGRGSNLKAILNSSSSEKDKMCVEAVITDKSDCKAIDLAKENQIPFYFVSNKKKEGFLNYSELNEKFEQLSIDLIVLAGFLKKIPNEFVDQFENRIINIHPALLPSFGGKGMYGMNVHNAVFNSSVQVSGVTVHFVNKIYDNGKIIAQRCVDISDVKSADEIASRVLEIEHQLLPSVIKKMSQNKVKQISNRVYTEN